MYVRCTRCFVIFCSTFIKLIEAKKFRQEYSEMTSVSGPSSADGGAFDLTGAIMGDTSSSGLEGVLEQFS